MIIETTEYKQITREASLNDILDIKKKAYIKNIFPKYSMKEKQKFIEKSLTINYSSSAFFLSLTGFFMSTISVTCLAATSSMYFFILIFLGLFMVGIFQIPFIKNKLINMWMSENKNVLQNEMFKEAVVDKDVLKSFVKMYSEKQLVILLNEKENIRYKDIYFYIDNQNKYKEQGDKIKNLSDAVKCLSD